MKTRSGALLGRILCALLAAAGSAAAEPKGRYIEISWLGPGAVRRELARLDLDALPQTDVRRYDPQYEAEVHARGVPLEQLLARVGAPAGTDLALLRFDNGLLIPVAFRDAARMDQLRPFVARAAALDPRLTLLPGRLEDPRAPPTREDLRAVRFGGNKVIVADSGHPDVLPEVAGALRPWMYADSLSRIELVERAAWEHQLDVSPETAAGLRVYLGSCRFCHAVRGTGGALGWDFVDPYPIYSDEWLRRLGKGSEERSPTPGRTLLSLHVRFRPEGAGRSMPALRAMRRDQIEALWIWLQVVATRSLRPYGAPVVPSP